MNKITISINDNNEYFSLGLQQLLENLLPKLSTSKPSISFVKNNSNSIQTSDIYICNFHVGEQFVCKKEFAKRKKNSLLIIITDKPYEHSIEILPSCLQYNTIFITRNSSLESINNKIAIAWGSLKMQTTSFSPCASCQCVTLQGKDKWIIDLFCKGFSIASISRILMIDEKKVSYYKRGVMKKLGIHANADLIALKDILIK